MNCCQKKSILVETNCGAVRGSKMKTKKGKKIFAFRGIPYAKPPVGELRFRRSEPMMPWEGVLNCMKEAKKAYQPNVLAPESPFRDGGEDCLYLNVYTKEYPQVGDGPVSSEEPRLLPVIVFLHGGAFVVGSCESMLYGPQVILDRDVILVGVNYRLGAFGFLSLESDDAPGNLGLHDQYLALKWVKENISSFGGDPDNVTLMGESAGAMSAMCHIVSPFSAGLFHRVFASSGTFLNALLHNDRSPKNYAISLAIKLGYSGDQSDKDNLLKYLQSRSSLEIIKASMMFMDWDYAFPMPWVPIIDSYSDQPFLPKQFKDATQEENLNKVPVVIALCKDEGHIMTAPYYQSNKRWDTLCADWDQWASLLFLGRERELISDSDKQVAQDIGHFYFGQDQDIATLTRSEENLKKLGRIYSMAYFYSGADHDSRLLAKAGFPIFNFILSHPPDFSLMDIFRLTLPQMILSFSARSMGFHPYQHDNGVCHGDDLNYLFPMSPFPKSVVTEEQKRVQQILLDILSSLSLSGKPVYSDESDGLKTDLEPLSNEYGIARYLNLSSTPNMINDEDMKKEIEFWNSVHQNSRNGDWKLVDKMPSTFYTKIASERR